MLHHVPLMPRARRPLGPAPAPLGPAQTLAWSFLIFVASGFFTGLLIHATSLSEWRGFAFFYAPIQCALIVTVIRRQTDFSPDRYLCIAPVSSKTIVAWTGALLLFILVEEILSQFIDTAPPTGLPDPDSLWAIWLTLIVAAPVVEEMFFRGFIFRGLETSALGPWGAIVCISFAWALLHVQYDAFGVTVVFFAGLFLGAARFLTGSLLTPLWLHSTMNLWACVEALLMGRTPV